jgi:hypothetical protein
MQSKYATEENAENYENSEYFFKKIYRQDIYSCIFRDLEMQN